MGPLLFITHKLPAEHDEIRKINLPAGQVDLKIYAFINYINFPDHQAKVSSSYLTYILSCPDLPLVIENSHIAMYADDTIMYTVCVEGDIC